MYDRTCKSCGGTGKKLDLVGGTFPCQRCNGSGYEPSNSEVGTPVTTKPSSSSGSGPFDDLELIKCSAAFGFASSLFAFYYGHKQLNLDDEPLLGFTAAVGVGIFALLGWPLRRLTHYLILLLGFLLILAIAIAFVAFAYWILTVNT